MIDIALPKGRLGERAYGLFERCGRGCEEIRAPGRRLVFENPQAGVRFFWVKPSDVPIYVERGAADLGVAGKDVLLEHAADALNTLHLVQARRGVCPYCNTKFIRMLGQLHRKDSSVVLDNQSLQLLLSYDKINNTNYVQTLRIYLANSCNVTQTARQLFVHRHTLLKRLEKICQIGQVDLDDYYTRVHMSITLLFHDYFVY